VKHEEEDVWKEKGTMVSLLLMAERPVEQRTQAIRSQAAGMGCYRPDGEPDIPLAFRPTVLRNSDDAQADCLAHSYLVAACEQALFDLLCNTGEGKSPEDIRIGLIASDVVREILGYWRERLDAAKAAVPANDAY
jgi:hypothetical protein